MADIETTSAIDIVHGKFKKADKGYFYVRNGKQFYRDREETYQKNQSPKQKYNSEAFAYANRQLALLKASPESEAQLKSARQPYCLQRKDLLYSLGMEVQLFVVRI